MKRPDDIGFESRELSIDELDAIAGGGFLSWIKNEVVSAAKAVGSALLAADRAVYSALGGGGHINITIHKQN